MQIRFLHTTESAAPGYPFQAGQVITLTKLTAEARRWIADGLAELVREDGEVPTLPAIERAVTTRKGRR